MPLPLPLPQHALSAPFRFSMTMLTALIMVVGVVGTVCVLVVFLADRSLWKPSYTFIGVLACLDLLHVSIEGTLQVYFLVRDIGC